mmetsp:Transcript_6809/g.8159  ORF Transcript_6809/g.8159 Transcript_6809/m.8159 type:complete len:718 (-) Transcript_6809:54-2207(-)|eukprot:CAMPEP_0197335466 /NCGR_PEP_ID=MMETSP0892-20130614/32825_1 /TAXON_ID=44058 ORGANISM="Aureoumbra lagunensis, Strain CCMP1510" /NCGR_SAMPLE_ID=MMETSP0892 /ASSEMBLY_ACC=CAM_ASM_000538 /LENGTH=717 /DNA_ID=CAMNT_0042836823 /DNA_START=19 /DNA_END=2172 /DNA_ORIENTATION=-
MAGSYSDLRSRKDSYDEDTYYAPSHSSGDIHGGLTRSAIMAPVLSVLMICVFVGYSWPEIWRGDFRLAHWESSSLVMTDLEIRTSSEEYGSYKMLDMYPEIEALAEPGRNTKLEAKGGVAAATSTSLYTWYIDGIQIGTTSSKTLTHIFPHVGTYRVQVSALGQGATESATIKVTCKYVRRELRDLTKRDRDAFLGAAKTLWTTSDKEGRAQYGTNYKSVHYFVRMHLYYAASKDCDHWHEGPGFYTSHIAMSLQFERSLQSVDSTVSLPYWDFTKDEYWAQGDPMAWRNASFGVFADDVLGPAAPSNENHLVDTGFWAGVSVMKNAQKYSRIVNANNELRAPWINPIASISGFRRHQVDETSDDTELSPPSCKHHWWALNQPSWAQLAANLNGASHGSMHKLIGGAWNAKLSYNISTAAIRTYTDDTWTSAIAAYNFFFLKLVYRSGIADCSLPETSCSCDADILKKYSAYEILDRVGILQAIVDYQTATPAIGAYIIQKNSTFTFPYWDAQATDQVLNAILERACDWGEEGDMNAASSTFDPSFWPIHPTIDRIAFAVRLGRRASGLSFDSTWPDGASPCYGHNASHIQPFTYAQLFGGENHTFLTNMDLYRLFDPTNLAHLPYLYDSYEWSHCNEQRYCMNLTIVNYETSPWTTFDCKNWNDEYDGVGRGYVMESDLTVPQLHPPALWDAHGNFITDPEPRPSNQRFSSSSRRQ